MHEHLVSPFVGTHSHGSQTQFSWQRVTSSSVFTERQQDLELLVLQQEDLQDVLQHGLHAVLQQEVLQQLLLPHDERVTSVDLLQQDCLHDPQVCLHDGLHAQELHELHDLRVISSSAFTER
jgi:hypothetical protein